MFSKRYVAYAHVVNMSWDVSGSHLAMDRASTIFHDIAYENPQTLFVVVAPNQHRVLSWLSPFAGVVAPNVIGVMGTAKCDPSLLWSTDIGWDNSAGDFPAGHIIAAPAVDIPVAKPNGTYGVESGNSFAVPQVSSLAAVLRWLQPSWSAADVKEYLLSGQPSIPNHFYARDAMMPTDPDMVYPVIDFYLAIIAQLRNLAGTNATATSRIDKLTSCANLSEAPCGLHDTDSAGYVMARTCGSRFDFWVSGVGPGAHVEFMDADPDHGGFFIVQPAGWGIEINTRWGTALTITNRQDQLELGFAYGLNPDIPPPPGKANLAYVVTSDSPPSLGYANDNPQNHIVFTSCQINQRFGGGFTEKPDVNEPWEGWIEGEIVGGILWAPNGDFSRATNREMHGVFRWPFTVNDPETYRYLDGICYGGSERLFIP
jgi:hypothetical protein